MGGAKGSPGAMMFSPRDGRIGSPELPAGTGLGSVEFFDGGFAADVDAQPGDLGVQLFDPTGRVVSKRVRGELGGTTGNLVGVHEVGGQYGIYGPGGDKLLELPSGAAARLIGSTLYVAEQGSSEDQPNFGAYDMRTGAKGRTVQIDLGRRYLGTDGSVVLRAVMNGEVAQLAKAYDLETSRELWSIPTKAGSLGRLYIVDTTLVQVSDDGTRLCSLVPPT